MCFTHSQNVEEDPRVPPKRDACFINNLPPELLSHMFGFGHPADDEDKGAEVTDGPNLDSTGFHPLLLSPIVLSHVCRHWRTVTLSTPSLWTAIGVYPARCRSYELESMMLQRSKALPIDVRVGGPSSYCDCVVCGGSSDIDFTPLFSILIPHIHRWRTMEVRVCWRPNAMHAFLSAVSDPSVPAASQLRTLKLVFDGRVGDDSRLKRLTLPAGSTPLLTTLVLSGVGIDWNPRIASAPNLTNLDLQILIEDACSSWTQFMTILRGAPSLEKLWVSESTPSGNPVEGFTQPVHASPTDPTTPIQLPRLTYLSLRYMLQTRVIGLLRKLSLPALEDLVLEFDEGDYTELVHELVRPAVLQDAQERPRSLLSRLTNLTINDLPFLNDSVKTLYGELQNLRTLNVSLWDGPLLLDILGTPCTLPGRGGVWLPRLETLIVSGSFGGSLCEVVQRRRDLGVPLSSVYVCEGQSDDLEEEEFEWLKKNLETVEYY